MCESGRTSCYFGTNQVSLNQNGVWCLSFLGNHRLGGEISRFPATKKWETVSSLSTLTWCIIFKWNSHYPNAEIIWDKQTPCPGIYMKTNRDSFYSFFFFQNQQVQAFLGECLSGPRPIIPSSSNSPISTISQRPVQSLCPTNRAKMIGLDCPCPTEMLYPQKNNPATEYCLIFIPLREASFSRKVMICLKIDDAFWFKVTECEFFWGLFFFFFVLVPYISFFLFFLFLKRCWVDFHTVTN